MANGVLFAAKVTAKRVAHAARHLRAGNPERAFEDLRFPAEVNAFLARSGGGPRPVESRGRSCRTSETRFSRGRCAAP